MLLTASSWIEEGYQGVAFFELNRIEKIIMSYCLLFFNQIEL